jgi:SAM-dependent methyltransferase
MNHRQTLKQTRKMWYEFFARQYGQGQMYFMNYGYNDPNDISKPVMLDQTEEMYRLQIQLYHHVVGEINIENRSVLEVGCGGGAGSIYLNRHFHPKRLTGVDLAMDSIRCCSLGHSFPNLQYLVADAENLPFLTGSFDIAINVESSHGYVSMSSFLNSISRILTPGGYFLFADFRAFHELATLEENFKSSGLVLIKKRFISQNVLEAMALQENPKQVFLLTIQHPELRNELREFIGAKGSFIYEGLKSGKMAYLSYVLQKPASL